MRPCHHSLLCLAPPTAADLQTCRGHDGCATRWCDPLTKKCGCPAPLVAASSGTFCERILSRKAVPPVDCGLISCDCPPGAMPTADGVGCALETREKYVLPMEFEPDPCFNDKLDQDETDTDCGGSRCLRRCGAGQLCKRDQDCAGTAQCASVVVERGANGTTSQEKRCQCPSGRFLSFDKDSVPSCVRPQQLCTNGQLDPSTETDVDCGGACVAQFDKLCGYGKRCVAGSDCDSTICDPLSRQCVCGPNLVVQGPFCVKPPTLPPVATPAGGGTGLPPGIIPVNPLPPPGTVTPGTLPPGATPPTTTGGGGGIPATGTPPQPSTSPSPGGGPTTPPTTNPPGAVVPPSVTPPGVVAPGSTSRPTAGGTSLPPGGGTTVSFFELAAVWRCQQLANMQSSSYALGCRVVSTLVRSTKYAAGPVPVRPKVRTVRALPLHQLPADNCCSCCVCGCVHVQ